MTSITLTETERARFAAYLRQEVANERQLAEDLAKAKVAQLSINQRNILAVAMELVANDLDDSDTFVVNTSSNDEIADLPNHG